ncbi:hypothetical protein PLUTE_b0494 [Pseudoalteromonas luteoviolacea DSM 6061]|nr:hypothetical protein [Pseudoalteromonas luteoviolacea DSM 6061]
MHYYIGDSNHQLNFSFFKLYESARYGFSLPMELHSMAKLAMMTFSCINLEMTATG